ncbi:hypothetical protein SCP_1602040 [Sparassis crispa]|uniref:BTB domain-containing protein n=1 Tax=Sparassis crispa TaxID=139825 RepID=A0A401H552_9APHY|nr:hypothetical protein SCP_1602040 [Sparassis crispa]GBE89542.1 hypothetical protein SCP_1602040 [Sparassis crispa]
MNHPRTFHRNGRSTLSTTQLRISSSAPRTTSIFASGVILSEASPFFKDMFSLQQAIVDHTKCDSTGEYRDGRRVIAVGEDSRTLKGLLRLCHPITDPELNDLIVVKAVLEATLKCQMDEATAITRKALRSFAPAEPLRI